MGYGKHYTTMYSGSMFGCGAMNFAMMGYVLSNFRASRDHGATVELNPKLLAAIFGEPVKEIESSIKFLCSSDKESRTKEEGGRRLVRLGEFEYRVVNGAKYRAQRDDENRREQNREAQERFRAKMPVRKSSVSKKWVTNGDLKVTPEEAGRRAENPFDKEQE
jgi:hypothetical protein